MSDQAAELPPYRAVLVVDAKGCGSNSDPDQELLAEAIPVVAAHTTGSTPNKPATIASASDVAPAARRDAILAATWMGRSNPLSEMARPVARHYAEELRRLAKEFTDGEQAFLPASPWQVVRHPAAVLASSFISDSDNEEIDKVAAYFALATAARRNC